MKEKIILGDCRYVLESSVFREETTKNIALTFLDPPFNQDKDYAEWDDDLPEEEYWKRLQEVICKVFELRSCPSTVKAENSNFRAPFLKM